MMATHNTLHVEVVTAEREIYSGEADMVVAKGTEGMLGILPRHAALLTTLAIGEMRIKLGGAEEPLFVAGGFLEVRDNVVTVLADTAEHAEEIDEARAEEARRRAQERLEQATSDVERADMLGALERAINRIKVAELARRRGGRRIEMPRYEQ
jgi:F-type H+-transporting ATPase subunit epsilon